MAWRFKASKYKNAAPIVPKPEACIRDITVGSYQSYGNNIAASAAFMAFNWDHAGSSLAVLPLDDCGRKSKTMPLLHAHTDTVTDLQFSPFHDGLLVTGSQDCLLKVWHIPEKGLETTITEPECTFSHKQRRVETVGFHPTADCLIHSTSVGRLCLWDLTSQKEAFSNNEHPEVIQSASWRLDGTLMATTCKDKMVRILDPRSTQLISMSANSHQSIKDSRVIWLADNNKILTTGFDSNRLRQVYIRDIRKLNSPEKSLELDCTTGILMPLYDPDTNMLFLAGKGDSTIIYMEVSDNQPHLIEGLRHTGEQTKGASLVPKRALRIMEGEVNRVLQLTSNSVIPIMYQVPRKSYRDYHSDLYPDTNGYRTELQANDWLEGKNLPVAKMSLDPNKRELGDKPITPRLGPKPFTSSSASDMSFDQVFTVPQAPGNGNAHNKPDVIPYCDNGNGVENKKEAQPDTLEEKHDNGTTKDINEEDEEVTYRVSTLEKRKETNIETNNKIFESMQMGDSDLSRGNSLDSVDADLKRMSAHRSSIAERRRMYESSAKGSEEKPPQSPIVSRSESMKQQPEATATVTADPFRRPQLPKKSEDKVKEPSPAMTKRTSTVFGKVSKYRHLKCTPAHKSTHIENLRNISRQIPGECNGFHANHKRVAIPLSGQGGKIAVYELSKAGRQPDGVIPSLVNGSNIMDFQWDPFDADRLAVAMDDGVVKLWRIPADGLKEPTNDAEQELSAHVDKIYFIRFHPTANNILVTASYDLTIKFWNLDTSQNVITLKGHTDQIFDFAWSPCGRYCATVCRDGKIRIFDPRCLDTPIREGPGPVGTRGARITFAIDGQYIVCTGFDKVSERQISVYKVSNLSAPLNTVGLDVSPAILMIYYDEDSSTLFLTGKGDSTIYAFEITDESPFICPLSHHRSMSLHQGLSFISKNHCDVANVEFAKAYRLTNTTVEPLSFTVPRIKSELFQDDLFPLTRITWSPTLSAKEWFDGVNRVVQKVNLQPEGMESLSSLNSQSTPQHTSNTPAKVNPSAQAVNPTWVPSNGSSSESQKEKEKEIQKSISERMEFTTKLEQDDMEGVDEQEWQE